ncbi:hypothetical protein [Dokdonella koreensis]|uniref:DUF3052 domain containing protein n=1 Tax=Dokdonella koreensis DS-123 TaxID=1300342 RepID=A0A160DS89_9GAMM|nr:hypothetical protein [Dokdonella koreensis]ANB17138.1 Hypothetical protein I596_1108 [Dokdonella koreensis DS-123]
MSGPPTAGYSGKPLWQKLGLAPGLRVHLRGFPPAGYPALTGLAAADLNLVGPRAAFDLAHVFATRAAALAQALAALDPRLPPAGTLWVSWPKRSAGTDTDITEDTIRTLALPLGLVDVKVCAVDALWSGLKLVRRKALRPR